MDQTKFNASQYKGKIRETVKMAEALRADKNKPVDISFRDLVKEKFQTDFDTFMADLGINPNIDTIQNIFTLPDEDIRWIIPEIIREALLLGYRAAPIWPNVISHEESTTGLTQVLPWLNMSESAPKKVGEGETIPVGSLSWGQKKFSIYKIGRGIKIPYEVTQYSSLQVVKIFLRDFGIKLGHATDTLAIDCLINGEQADGSESAPVIGVASAGTKTYKDFLKIWVRLSRCGRMPNVILGGEAAAALTLDLDEFKRNAQYIGSPLVNMTLKTPIPQNMNYFIHGNIPSNQELMVDPATSLIKFNAQPLLVESEKIVSNQTEAFYATLTTGFAKLFRDSTVIMDSSVAFSPSYGFPSYMDIDPFQNVVIE